MRDRASQPERFYIEAYYYARVEGNPQRAIEIYQAWRRMYPGSFVAATNLPAMLAGLMGDYEAAVPVARDALRLDRGSSPAYRNLVMSLLGSGRFDEARRAAAEALSRAPQDPLVHLGLLSLAFLDDDSAAIARETAWMSRDPVLTLLALRQRASGAMAAGRLAEARRLWAEALAKAGEVGSATRTSDTRLDQALAEALLGDPAAARAAAEAAIAGEKRPRAFAAAALVFALAGEPARADRLLDHAAGQPSPDAMTSLVSLPIGRAMVLAREGRAGEAVAILQPVTPFERGAEFLFAPLGVRALVMLAAGRPADARAAFLEIEKRRGIQPVSPWVAFARLGVARALQEAGDVEGSRAAYDAAIERVKDGDKDAPILLAARKERAALR